MIENFNEKIKYKNGQNTKFLCKHRRLFIHVNSHGTKEHPWLLINGHHENQICIDFSAGSYTKHQQSTGYLHIK